MTVINITKITKGEKITSRNFGSLLSSIASCLPSLKVNIPVQWINLNNRKTCGAAQGTSDHPSAIIAS